MPPRRSKPNTSGKRQASQDIGAASQPSRRPQRPTPSGFTTPPASTEAQGQGYTQCDPLVLQDIGLTALRNLPPASQLDSSLADTATPNYSFRGPSQWPPIQEQSPPQQDNHKDITGIEEDWVGFRGDSEQEETHQFGDTQAGETEQENTQRQDSQRHAQGLLFQESDNLQEQLLFRCSPPPSANPLRSSPPPQQHTQQDTQQRQIQEEQLEVEAPKASVTTIFEIFLNGVRSGSAIFHSDCNDLNWFGLVRQGLDELVEAHNIFRSDFEAVKFEAVVKPYTKAQQPLSFTFRRPRDLTQAKLAIKAEATAAGPKKVLQIQMSGDFKSVGLKSVAPQGLALQNPASQAVATTTPTNAANNVTPRQQ